MSRRFLHAAIWDKTQYFLSNYYDRMIRFASFHNGVIDLKNMQLAVKSVVDRALILRSSYVLNIIVPFWVVHNKYTLEEMVELVRTQNVEQDTYEFLKCDISRKSKLQFRCKIFTDGVNSSFALVVNHQCCDGHDFKYITTKIIEAYNAICEGRDPYSIPIKDGTRSLNQLYKKMDPIKAKKAKKLYNNASKVGIKKPFKFTKDKDIKKYFVINTISIEDLNKAKDKAKIYKATVTDLLLAAAFRSLAKEADYSKEEPLSITSMIDLRRHFLDGDTDGITNMTAFMPCKVDGIGDNFEETLLKVANYNNALKEDELVGLYGIPLLALAYKIFIDVIARIAIKIGYDNPLMQISNHGILKENEYSFYNCKLKDLFLTGTVKYKPYMQLTCITTENYIKLCIAEKCSEKEKEMVENFLANIVKEIQDFAK